MNFKALILSEKVNRANYEAYKSLEHSHEEAICVIVVPEDTQLWQINFKKFYSINIFIGAMKNKNSDHLFWAFLKLSRTLK